MGLCCKGLVEERLPFLPVAVLGLEGSGKSTLLKQFRILHGEPYTAQELNDVLRILCFNLFEGLKDLRKDIKNLSLNSSENQAFLDEIETISSTETIFTEDLAQKIRSFMSDEVVKTYFREYWNVSEIDEKHNFIYVVEGLERLAQPDYSPTRLDILHARQATTGLTRIRFRTESPKAQWEFVDAGGQPSERTRWALAYENARIVLFCVAINEFNFVSEDPNKTSRLHEAKEVFQTLASEEWSDKAVLLFLNKNDLFKQKVSKLHQTFKNYKGGSHYRSAVDFIARFLTEGLGRSIYCFDTCALDDSQMTVVFSDVRHMITKKLILENL